MENRFNQRSNRNDFSPPTGLEHHLREKMKKRPSLESLFLVYDPTDTQNEPKTSFSSLKTDDFVQFLEYISFPQQSALKHLLTDER